MPDNHSESSGEFINGGTQTLTPELVRQVTDKVYKLFLKDLKQENERRRNQNSSYRR
jgi:hypothetical protein